MRVSVIKLLVALPLLSFPATAQPSEIPPSVVPPIVDTRFVSARVVPDFDKDILAPLRIAQAEKAKEDARLAEKARLAEEAAEAARVASEAKRSQPSQAVAFSSSTSGELTGSLGYSLPYGNCINEPGVNNPGWGSPYQWPVLTGTPVLGGTVLFTWNHTAIISGLWSNGDLEVRQQNSPGFTHRIPISMVKGFR